MDSPGHAQRFGGGEIASSLVLGDAAGTFEHHRLLAAMQSLPVRWQAALWHVEVLGRTQEEAAPFLGIHAGLVAEVLVQAGKGLRLAYERQGT